MNREDYSKYYIQGSDHYLIPKDIFDELFTEIENWKKEARKSEEVIDKAIEIIKDNIPEEYVRSCDTADYIGRYELDTETWQYKVYEMLKEVE